MCCVLLLLLLSEHLLLAHGRLLDTCSMVTSYMLGHCNGGD
jgi:hypothetical protein